MKQKLDFKKENPTAIKVSSVILVCSTNHVDFNNKCDECLGAGMFSHEPLGMYFLKDEINNYDIALTQVFVGEEENAQLMPEEILPEKLTNVYICKSENVGEFNSELQACIGYGYLMADPVRVNRPPDSNQLIFTAMFIKTSEQKVKVYKNLVN